jgi:hypothetical protein
VHGCGCVRETFKHVKQDVYVSIVYKSKIIEMLKWPRTKDWMDKLWYFQEMEYYTAMLNKCVGGHWPRFGSSESTKTTNQYRATYDSWAVAHCRWARRAATYTADCTALRVPWHRQLVLSVGVLWTCFGSWAARLRIIFCFSLLCSILFVIAQVTSTKLLGFSF